MTQIEIRTMECVCAMSRTLSQLAKSVEQSAEALVSIGNSLKTHNETMERLAKAMGAVKVHELAQSAENVGKLHIQIGRLTSVVQQELKSGNPKETEA